MRLQSNSRGFNLRLVCTQDAHIVCVCPLYSSVIELQVIIHGVYWRALVDLALEIGQV